MIRMTIDGVTATATEKEVLTAGRVGLRCAFEFVGGEWGGLFKTAVFQGIETIDVALPTNECVVPWEAMAVEGVNLKVGVYGANGNGDIVIPTVWANFGKIQPSAVPSGVDPATPSQNANAYAVETAEEAKQIAQSVRTDADNGVFDGAPGADGADGATIWTTTVAPTEPIGGGYEFMVSDLTGASGATPAVGDLIFYDSAYYPITSITGHSIADKKAVADQMVDIRGADGATGATGPQGPAGPGVPTGGTTGQVLKKASGTDYDTEWANESGGSSVDPYTSTPADLGTASAGSSDKYARGDHVHKLPSASDVGAIAAPVSPSAGDVLTYSSGAWTAAAPASVPIASSADPLMDGTKTSGSSTDYARADHVHPTDTSRQSTANIVTTTPCTSERNQTTKYYAASASWAWMNKIVPGYYSTGPNQSGNGWAVGDYCNMAGVLYRCTVANNNEAFNVSHWTAITDVSKDLMARAVQAPASPATGAFLVWDGSAWTAQTLSTWQGGNY